MTSSRSRSVFERQAFCQPIRTTIAVVPLRTGLKENLLVATRFVESSCLRCQVQECDLLRPVGLGLIVRRLTKSTVVVGRQVIEFHVAVLQCEPQHCRAEGFGRGLDVVSLLLVTPLRHDIAILQYQTRATGS